MPQENLTEDETTLVLLSLSYTLACLEGKGATAQELLEHIIEGGSQSALVEMCNQILNKLDVTVVKPFNTLPC